MLHRETLIREIIALLRHARDRDLEIILSFIRALTKK